METKTTEEEQQLFSEELQLSENIIFKIFSRRYASYFFKNVQICKPSTLKNWLTSGIKFNGKLDICIMATDQRWNDNQCYLLKTSPKTHTLKICSYSQSQGHNKLRVFCQRYLKPISMALEEVNLCQWIISNPRLFVKILLATNGCKSLALHDCVFPSTPFKVPKNCSLKSLTLGYTKPGSQETDNFQKWQTCFPLLSFIKSCECFSNIKITVAVKVLQIRKEFFEEDVRKGSVKGVTFTLCHSLMQVLYGYPKFSIHFDE
ncbi:unnamed protein product [Moneuplotes crassus]|uniref:Uncharacterized protein n=1 Tax=Euplotes crassus TaxID=5936 RepID=A0AAD1XN37_EUPCR|nr:unnamed protein product [Moneuplotes crassus]